MALKKTKSNISVKLKNKELLRWKKAADRAAKDKKYSSEIKELGNDDGGLWVHGN
jgi:hypothetical protein